MAIVNKNDVNQIFAENAPPRDKPAEFQNYTAGWDTSRQNNGKPTIKQFNYLQQRTDQNILYIHQRGAMLPYDENIQYANGALVIKDGAMVQWDGSKWNRFGVGRDSGLVTWSGRSQEQKNKDSIHVLDFKPGSKTDQEAIQDAVNYCIENNRTLDWDGAHLTSTANIVDFWSVEHKGQGSITRNGHKFLISPILAQETEIVVKDGALTVNDGLSEDFPATMKQAFAYLATIGSKAAHGQWRIRIKGLISSTAVKAPTLPIFVTPLEIAGDDVAAKAEPTSVWSGLNQATYAVNFNRVAVNIKIKNLIIQDWLRAGGNSGGFVFDTNCNVFVENCRFRRMNIGIWTQKSYLNVQNSEFSDIDTFACSVAYNGYGNVGSEGGNGNTFKNCNIGVAVGRGAICYVTGNRFEDINLRCIEINKNARCREHGNTYVNYKDGFSLQCCVLAEEGAIFNNDNSSGLPSTITAELSSDRPFLRLLSGASFQLYTPKTGMAVHSSASKTTPVAIRTDDLINLNTEFGVRLLSLPAYALYTDAFKIQITMMCSMSANTTFVFRLNGQGEATSTSLGQVTFPTVTETTSFPITITYEKFAGNDTIFCYAESTRLNFGSSVGQNTTALSNALVRAKSESILIFRPHIQRTSGTGVLNVNAVKVHLEI